MSLPLISRVPLGFSKDPARLTDIDTFPLNGFGDHPFRFESPISVPCTLTTNVPFPICPLPVNEPDPIVPFIYGTTRVEPSQAILPSNVFSNID